MSTRACLTAIAMALLPGFALAQTITPLANKPPSDGVIYGYLQTDGTVLFQGGGVTDWSKLAPDVEWQLRQRDLDQGGEPAAPAMDRTRPPARCCRMGARCSPAASTRWAPARPQAAGSR